ncbi:MAG TPA: hypothetical protein VLZ89_00840 [Anaerolineales bacterium]|nr:hypothetical protein [Anaerolineales bacterium]
MSDQIEPRKPRPVIHRSPIPAAPVHPLAALTTLVLDNLFGVIEIADPLLLLFTGLAVGTICTVTVAFVQRYMSKDEWGPAIAKGLVMGVIAGVPFQVTGTAAGGILLAWAGLHEWIKLPFLKKDGSPNDDPEVIDLNPK